MADPGVCEWADEQMREACTEPGIVRTIYVDLGWEVGLCPNHYEHWHVAGKVGPMVGAAG